MSSRPQGRDWAAGRQQRRVLKAVGQGGVGGASGTGGGAG